MARKGDGTRHQDTRLSSSAKRKSSAIQRRLVRLQCQKARLDVESACEAGELAGGTDNAMARRNNGNGISADGGAHGAHGFGLLNLPGDFRVAARFPEGNGEQRLPDFLLEFRTLEIEFQRERVSFSCEVAVQLAFSFEKHGMVLVLRRWRQANAMRLVVLPENSHQAFVAGHQL